MNCRFFTWETAIQIKGTLVSLSLFPFTSFHFLGIFLSLKGKKKRKEKSILKREREDHGLSSKEFTHCLNSLFHSSAATNTCLWGYSLNCHPNLLLRGRGARMGQDHGDLGCKGCSGLPRKLGMGPGDRCDVYTWPLLSLLLCRH